MIYFLTDVQEDISVKNNELKEITNITEEKSRELFKIEQRYLQVQDSLKIKEIILDTLSQAVQSSEDNDLKKTLDDILDEKTQSNLIANKNSRFNSKNESPKIGYAYYGFYASNDWTDQNFINTDSEDRNKIPEKNDIIQAKNTVNIRSGVIDRNSKGEWFNKEIIGVIEPDTEIKVLDVYKIPRSNYYWIKFSQTF